MCVQCVQCVGAEGGGVEGGVPAEACHLLS